MRTTQGCELFGELIEDDFPIRLTGGIQRLHARLQRLQIIDGSTWFRLMGVRELRLNLFEVLLDLLLVELDGIDIRPQLAEALVED